MNKEYTEKWKTFIEKNLREYPYFYKENFFKVSVFLFNISFIALDYDEFEDESMNEYGVHYYDIQYEDTIFHLQHYFYLELGDNSYWGMPDDLGHENDVFISYLKDTLQFNQEEIEWILDMFEEFYV